MEYFALILNRSFLVFITDAGLQGWKFCGNVTSFHDTGYYESVEEQLDDPEIVPGSATFNELMTQPGTFLIRYSEIASATFTAKRKWGMGYIHHSGVLTVELATGRRRELILLGDAKGDAIRDTILARASVLKTR